MLAGAAALPAQTTAGRVVHNHNTWYNWFGHHHVSGPWGVHTEIQFRRSGWGESWQQLLMRYGVTRSVSPRVRLVLGYGYIKSYPFGEDPLPAPFPEHRLWQDVQWTRPAGRTVMLNRFRLEQRFLGQVRRDAAGQPEVYYWRYANRFRWMLRETIPLGRHAAAEPGWYIPVYNEFWVNFGRNAGSNWFDQNRAFVGAGYRFNKWWAVDGGYLHQVIRKPRGRVWENNHTTVISLHCAVPLIPR